MWNIVGHESAVALLRRGMEKGTTSHAYLFVGPPHVGKMTLAVNLAQALNCEAADRPCGVCNSCRRIAEGKHADTQVIEMEQVGEGGETSAKTRISVEQVDQVLHSVNLPPFEGRCKVFIFDGSENMSIQAANRMLKTLEEPVSKVVFVLVTANVARVPATVISRCQRIEFFPLPIPVVEQALVERWRVEQEKARLLARLSVGRLGWAVAMVKDENLLRQRSEWLDEWLQVLGSDLDQRFAFAARVVERFSQNRQSLYDRLALLIDWWRDLLLVKTGNGDMITNLDREARLQEMAGRLSLGQIREFITRVQAALDQLQKNASAQLVMEVLLLNAPEPARDVKLQ